MIINKRDLKYYLKADMYSLNIKKFTFRRYFFDDIWKFQRVLRKVEFYNNTSTNFFNILIFFYHRIRLRNLGIKLGFSIPINVFGPGLSIAHRGTIVVSNTAKIGKNCRIHVCVNIGTSAGNYFESPIIGDNVYIGPGAKIFGKIHIGNNIAIGANSVVNKDFIQSDITIAGIPANIISKKGSIGLLIKGTNIVDSSKN
jgi:serine O-acetyltransferase